MNSIHTKSQNQTTQLFPVLESKDSPPKPGLSKGTQTIHLKLKPQ